MVVFKDVIECGCGRIRIVDFSIIEKAFQCNPSIRVLVKKAPTYSRGENTQKELKVSKVFEEFVENQTSWT